MAAVMEEVHKRFNEEKIEDILLKYNLTSNVTDLSQLVDKKCMDKKIYEILYVDDWVMFASNLVELQKMLNIANDVTRLYGQEIAIKKTKYMKVTRDEDSDNDNEEDSCEHLHINQSKIEKVTSFRYLGVIESNDGKMELELKKG